MRLLKKLLGPTAVVAILIVALYIYSNPAKKDTNPPSQTATVTDSLGNKESPAPSHRGEVVTAKPTSTPSKTPLEGLKDAELQQGLDNIKAGLDLLQNPVE